MKYRSQLRAGICVLCFAISAATDAQAFMPLQHVTTFVIDVGAAGDNDDGAPMHLDDTPRLSAPQSDGARSWRELDENAYLYFRLRTEGIDLSPSGVPNRDAILEVTFRDTVDEENCATLKSTRAYCRPRVATKLDYGDEPRLTWHRIGGVGGLADGEWKTTKVFLEAVPWQTLRSIQGYFEFYLQYPNQLNAHERLPIDEIRLRFVDETTFDREREADRAERSLIRREYEVKRELRARGSESFVLFAPNYLDKIYPNTVPRAAWLVDTVRSFELAGEMEPLTFAIHAFEAIEDVSVHVTDLVSRGGVIPSANVQQNLVGVLDKRWGYSYDRYYGRNPWFLDDMRAFSVPEGGSRQVWLTIDVPASAPAGMYTGRVTVTVPGVGVGFLALELTVFELELEPPDATPYVYHSPYLSSKHFAPRRITVARNMAQHDLNPIIYLDAEIDLTEYRVDVRDLADELTVFKSLGILPPEPRVGISDNVSALWRQLCPGVPIYEARCGDFDAAYVHVLRQYREAFGTFGVVPALSFTDEPGTDPVRRSRSNYLHRLTRIAGMRTWVTYYPRCEEPLAGHSLRFDDLATDAEPRVPDWLLADPGVRGHWDFTDGTLDRSPFANDGALYGGAEIVDGELVTHDTGDYMRVDHDEALDLEDAGTVYLWIKPHRCPTGYAWRPLQRYPGTEGANYVLYLFGDYDGQYPDNLGLLRMFADAGGWGAVSGSARVDCDRAPEAWYNVIWSYDADTGGTMYVNGVAHPGSRTGPLATKEAPLLVGLYDGAVDEVMLLDRALTPDEGLRIARQINRTYDTEQTATLTLDVAAPAAEPSTLTFSLRDNASTDDSLESRKLLTVNDATVWSATTIDEPNKLVAVDLGPHLQAGAAAQLAFTVTNRDARVDDIGLYFVEDAWRNAAWRFEGDANWDHDNVDDEGGSLGPMAPELDDRVHAMRYVTREAIDRTTDSGDSFSYYTTYPATQPVIVNNRFLNGVYASALGAEGVYVYAYGDWGAQPWDDTEPSYVERIGSNTARRSQNNYQLVLPSWDDRVYDTLAHEALREGIEDSRVIGTLKRAIADHPGPLADDAQAFLDGLFVRVATDYSPRYMSYDASRPIEQYADRSGEMLIDLAGDAFAVGVFDAARLEMIRYVRGLESGTGAWPVFLPWNGGH